MLNGSYLIAILMNANKDIWLDRLQEEGEKWGV